MNKIEAVVAPLKKDAIERAEKEARNLVERYTEKLKEAGFDLSIAAPYPKSGMRRDLYMVAMAKRQTYGMIVKHEKGSRRINDPEIVAICPEYVAKFIESAKKDAAEQYDVFVAKLIAKIGELKEATLVGNHVWSFSILKVVKPDGTTENWKTQMIVNVSKLGKLFNQWPTRKVKK